MVEIVINETGERIDNIGEITYVYQMADLSNITKSVSSRSWSFKIPKTPNNIKTFEFIGISGAVSSIQYQKVVVSIYDNGNLIENNAILTIDGVSTNDYSCNIKSGVFDLMDAIGDLSIGDLDLQELNHDNSPTNIIASWNNDLAYKYIIVDYGAGFSFDKVNEEIHLESKFLLPSARVSYLFDKIAQQIGWTFNLWEDGVFSSYPAIFFDFINFPFREDNATHVTVAKGDTDSFYKGKGKVETILIPSSVSAINGSYLTFDNITRVFTSVVQQAISITLPTITADKGGGNYIYYISVNGVIVKTIRGDYNDSLFVENIILNIGDGLKIILLSGVNMSGNVSFSEMEILRQDIKAYNYRTSFSDLKVKDLLKEVLIRYGLVMRPKTLSKKVDFVKITDRLTAPIQDWSNFLVEVESTSFRFGTYGQNNVLKHKYVEDLLTYNDGNISVNDNTLQVSTTLHDSKFYTSIFTVSLFGGTLFENGYFLFQNWEAKPKDSGGVTEVEWQPINGRISYLRDFLGITSLYLDDTKVFNITIGGEVNYKEVVSKYYQDYLKILNSAEIINVKVSIPPHILRTFDMSGRFYFSQLGGEYLMNRLTYKSGELLSDAEFIKIN